MTKVEGRKINRERTVALFQGYSLGNGDIIVQIITTCQNILIIDHEVCKYQMTLIRALGILTRHLYQSTLCTQIDSTFSIPNG